MRTIITGGRDFQDYDLLCESLDEVEFYGWNIDEVISGGAAGADSLGEKWALDNERLITRFPDKRHNTEMAEYAEALVAFWDGESYDTMHMIYLAEQNELFLRVIKI